MSEFINGTPDRFHIIPPVHPESNGHARIIDSSPRRQSRQWQVLSYRLAQALLITGVGTAAAVGGLEGIKWLGQALDSIPAEIGYSQPPSKSQPSGPDILRSALRKP